MKPKYLIFAIFFVIIVAGCWIGWLVMSINEANEKMSSEMKRLTDLKGQLVDEREKRRLEAERAHREEMERLEQQRIEMREKAEKQQHVYNQMVEILENTRIRYEDKMRYGNLDGYPDYLSYFTSDFNDDGIPELWIVGGYYISEGGNPFEVFVINDSGNVIKIGESYSLRFFTKNNLIYGLRWEDVEDWMISKYSVLGTNFYETVIDEGWGESGLEKYIDLEVIDPSPISSLSLLKNSFRSIEMSEKFSINKSSPSTELEKVTYAEPYKPSNPDCKKQQKDIKKKPIVNHKSCEDISNFN